MKDEIKKLNEWMDKEERIADTNFNENGDAWENGFAAAIRSMRVNMLALGLIDK